METVEDDDGAEEHNEDANNADESTAAMDESLVGETVDEVLVEVQTPPNNCLFPKSSDLQPTPHWRLRKCIPVSATFKGPCNIRLTGRKAGIDPPPIIRQNDIQYST